MYIKRSNRKGTNLFMLEAIYYAGNILLIILPAALALYVVFTLRTIANGEVYI